MEKKLNGPFKRELKKNKKSFKVDISLITIGLFLIALTQIPESIKTSLDLYCRVIEIDSQETKISLCK